MSYVVNVILVDPWEFVSANGSGPFKATLIRANRDNTDRILALLLELACPLNHASGEFKYFVATPRHEGVFFDEILSGASVASNLTGIPQEKAMGKTPFDLSWWRGGCTAIADLTLQR